MGHLSRLGHDHRESPAVDAAVPPSAALAAYRAVQADVGGDQAVVGLGALHPGVDVLQDPVPVLALARQGVGVEGQRRRRHVHRMVPDDVVVLLEVVQHLLVAPLAVARLEAPLQLDGVPRPVQRRRLAHEGAAAAVEHAADDPVLGIVVGRRRVLAHVEAGVAPEAVEVAPVVGVAEALQVEGREPLAVVEPVEHDGKLFVVHPVPSHRDLHRLGLGVLAKVALPPPLVHL